MTSHSLCPCGGGRPYACCCEPFHNGEAAPDAELLMRSRYCAYVLGLEPYLLASWHASIRPTTLDLAAKPGPRWLGLEIRRAAAESDSAIVEFVARCKTAGRAHRLHEISHFRRERGRWYYVNGEFPG